ncbi:small integral membrane protein 30-like [Synchiropus splendidus]|uniref:small integral membrane protein 30-like n=1 Tax=Synchiropus splendidus TaxID=270530 RepID=UPI00237DAB58|nr:small integral membrane protein 30-like [Synchiropus splendidus]
MTPGLTRFVAALCLIFLCGVSPVEAYDAGDVLALLLGTVLTVVGVCVCLGWYSRRRADRL